MSIVRLTDWMSGRWWAALAVALAFVLVARTGTVGAPAEASMPSEAGSSVLAGDRARTGGVASPQARIRSLEEQLLRAERSAELERERVRLIRASHDRLDEQLARITDRLRDEFDVELDPAVAPAGATLTLPPPVPVEALYIQRPVR